MKYAKSKNDIVNEYIGDLNDEIAPLFLEIRCLVYGTTKNHIQTVVGKGKVSLIFFEGTALNDKYGLLEGDGSKARTMRITSLDFNKTALKNYVKQTLKNEK